MHNILLKLLNNNSLYSIYCLALNKTEVKNSIKNPYIIPIIIVDTNIIVWLNSRLSDPNIAPKAAGNPNINPIIIPWSDQCYNEKRLIPMAIPISILPRIILRARAIDISYSPLEANP